MERTGFQKQERREASEDTTLPALESPEEDIPKSLVPWSRDDDRARYLGLRSSGFAVRAALGLVGKAKSSLSAWRHDPVFVALEEQLPELRKTLALEYVGLEFLRNFRLVLEKDNRVLNKSLEKKTKELEDGTVVDVPMSSQDFAYLKTMRSFYTPQQLQAIEAMFGHGASGDTGEGWQEIAMRMSRTTVTETVDIPVETRKRQESNLARTDNA